MINRFTGPIAKINVAPIPLLAAQRPSPQPNRSDAKNKKIFANSVTLRATSPQRPGKSSCLCNARPEILLWLFVFGIEVNHRRRPCGFDSLRATRRAIAP